jgi:hypothetical protein
MIVESLRITNADFARLSAHVKDRATGGQRAARSFVSEPSRFRTHQRIRVPGTAAEKAAHLPPESLSILQRIDQGPDLKAYEYHLTHRVRPEDVDAAKASIIDSGSWTGRILWRRSRR